jgi:hypothetical protein
MAEPQTYKNHTRLLPPFHFFVLPVLLLYVINALRHVWLSPSLSTGFGALVAAALLMAALLSRVQALTVQDRVIRLEMRLRLKQLLPADLQSRINDLTPKQYVALRFADDSELPELVRETLEGRLTTQADIKKRVKNWQGDSLRA